MQRLRRRTAHQRRWELALVLVVARWAWSRDRQWSRLVETLLLQLDVDSVELDDVPAAPAPPEHIDLTAPADAVRR